MATPVYIPSHAGAALGNLTEAYQNAAVTRAIVRAWGLSAQRIEDAFYQVLYSGLLGSTQVLIPRASPDPETGAVDLTGATPGVVVLDGSGAALDQLGALLAQPRGGLGDADYLILLKCAIIVYRSRGKTSDIQALLTAATPAGSSSTYTPAWPCGFVVQITGATGPTPIADFLRKAAPAGVKIWLETNAGPPRAGLYWGGATVNLTGRVPGSVLWGSAYGSVSGAGNYGNAQSL